MKQSWYGVRTFYRSMALGRPQNMDRHYDRDATLVEERVVLFKARSFDEAIEKSEKEAKIYAAGSYRNLYGQRVQQRYLGACDAFELFEPPGRGVEVYSSTEIVHRSTGEHALINSRFGKERKNEKLIRRKFMNRRLLTPPSRQ